jgi:hypothetical protein
MRFTRGRQPIGLRSWRQIRSNCPFVLIRHEGQSMEDFTGPSKSAVPNITRLKMPGEGLPSLKPSKLRGMAQQRQRERLQIRPAEPFMVVWIQAMPLDAVLSELATASAPLALAEAGQRTAPVKSGTPQRIWGFGCACGLEKVLKETSDRWCTRRTCLLGEISERVRHGGQRRLK